jgi:hypothetical protein
MIIECPICGKKVDSKEYSFDEEACFNCLKDIVETSDNQNQIDIEEELYQLYVE